MICHRDCPPALRLAEGLGDDRLLSVQDEICPWWRGKRKIRGMWTVENVIERFF